MACLFPSSSGTPSTCEEKAVGMNCDSVGSQFSCVICCKKLHSEKDSERKIISWLETGWNCNCLTVDFLFFALWATVAQASQSTQTWVLLDQ